MATPPSSAPAPRPARPFLGVQFIKCRTYGRLYRNTEGTAYTGSCPRCGAPVQVPIGTHGTSQRFFIAVCPGS